MRTRLFFLTCFVAGLAFLSVFDARANPLKFPKRMVSGQAVDLSPLFGWWTNHAGARPMTAWVHITGSVVATNGLGWVVNATVETARSARPAQTNSPSPTAPMRLVLKNPPVRDFAEFEQLRAQFKSLQAEKEDLSAQATDAADRARAIAQQQGTLIEQGKMYRQMGGDRRALIQQENRAGDQAKTLDEQLQGIQARLASYPSPDRYVLDCLALTTGQAVNGMLLFDHGVLPP